MGCRAHPVHRDAQALFKRDLGHKAQELLGFRNIESVALELPWARRDVTRFTLSAQGALKSFEKLVDARLLPCPNIERKIVYRVR
jgi:hypothetical protein